MSQAVSPAQRVFDADAVSSKALSRSAERALLWLYSFAGFLVLIEPAPADLLLLVLAPLFLTQRTCIAVSAIIPIVLLLIFNVGGLLSLVPWAAEVESLRFVVVSLFVALIAIFHMALVSHRTMDRLAAIASGTIWAGVMASVAGIIGFFDLAGLGEVFSLYGRAAGTFKDPNVLGTFVILPLVFAIQRLVLREGNLVANLVAIVTILYGGVLLSFSRGAWGHTLASVTLFLTLTYVFSDRNGLRHRILGFSVLCLALAAVLLPLSLAANPVGEMFATRANLEQDYDEGRFGNQIKGAGELLDLPNGFGPVRFKHLHGGRDPHNVFVNAFASYGWIGGFSYLALVLSTIVVGWRIVKVRVPEQRYVIAVWSVLFVQMLQGVQIDTDHWRHWFAMLGITWGLYGVLQNTGRLTRAAGLSGNLRAEERGISSSSLTVPAA